MFTTIILLVAVSILNLIDYVQTMYAIQTLGIGVEANPIARFLFEHNCAHIVKLILVPIAILAVGLVIKFDRRFAWVSYFLVMLYFGIVINNFIVLFRLGML